LRRFSNARYPILGNGVRTDTFFQLGSRLAHPGPHVHHEGTLAGVHGGRSRLEIFTGDGYHSLTEADTLTGGDVLPGLQIPVKGIFSHDD